LLVYVLRTEMEFTSQKTPRLYYKDQPFNAVYGDTALYFVVKFRDGNVKEVLTCSNHCFVKS